jgi:hypothetical protein
MARTTLTLLRAQELYRDFVRSRQNGAIGWPDQAAYSESDLRYFQTLEAERLAGRLEIEGRIVSLSEYPE